MYKSKNKFRVKPDLIGLPYLWLITGLSLVYLWLISESVSLPYALKPNYGRNRAGFEMRLNQGPNDVCDCPVSAPEVNEMIAK